jgi:hypothetical protein
MILLERAPLFSSIIPGTSIPLQTLANAFKTDKASVKSDQPEAQ